MTKAMWMVREKGIAKTDVNWVFGKMLSVSNISFVNLTVIC